MNSPSLVRWGAVEATIATLAWAAPASLFNLVFPRKGNGPLILSSEAIAEGAMLVALVRLRVLQARSLGRPGTIGFPLAFYGVGLLLLATLVGTVIPAAHLSGIVLDIVFGPGLSVWQGLCSWV